MPRAKSLSRSVTEEQVIRVMPDGSTEIDWVSVSFSDFVVRYVYPENERKQFLELQKKSPKKVRGMIFCG